VFYAISVVVMSKNKQKIIDNYITTYPVAAPSITDWLLRVANSLSPRDPIESMHVLSHTR